VVADGVIVVLESVLSNGIKDLGGCLSTFA
jgi:hypothetical protein